MNIITILTSILIVISTLMKLFSINDLITKILLLGFKSKLTYILKISIVKSKFSIENWELYNLLKYIDKHYNLEINKYLCINSLAKFEEDSLLLINDFNRIIKITDDIFMYLTNNNNKDMHIHILSKTLSIFDLNNFMENVKHNMYKVKHKTIRCVITMGRDIKQRRSMQFLLNSNKNFDNILFKDKELLLAKLNKFINCKEEYKRKGLLYNLGFIIYSKNIKNQNDCIKALANYTKRNVYIIDLLLVNVLGDMKTMLYYPAFSIGCQSANSIIVLDNIDYISESKNTNIKEIIKNLNGIVEKRERILIIKTSYTNKYNKLLRQGIIDVEIDVTDYNTL